MAFETRWHNASKTIVYQSFTGICDAAAYLDAVDALADHINSQSHRVDVIVDVRHADPGGFGFLAVIRQASQRIPAGERMYVVVGANAVVRSIVDIGRFVVPVIRRSVRFVATIEEAEATIQSQRFTRTASASN